MRRLLPPGWLPRPGTGPSQRIYGSLWLPLHIHLVPEAVDLATITWLVGSDDEVGARNTTSLTFRSDCRADEDPSTLRETPSLITAEGP